MNASPLQADGLSERIAVIGMACRFPGSPDAGSFWKNLCSGKECIRPLSDDELTAAGVDGSWLNHPGYVKAAGTVEGIDLFDAAFFNLALGEAALIDPQQRLMLECAWEAMESAGHAPGSFAGSVGVFAGSRISDYLLFRQAAPDLAGLGRGSPVRALQILIGNDKDHLATRISYFLNLKGPSITVQTTCSTSLVAVHLGCQSLLNYECDLALAGGVSLRIPQKAGHVYNEGMIFSPDGHTRTFAADAGGTIFSSGAGLVALRRLDEALADGDPVQAVILGSAVNNDGNSHKAGYTAPSAQGQSEVIREALSAAGAAPETISYIEAHGTATALGDPIEVEALRRVFGDRKREEGSCALGSVKSNLGHLVQAAGVAGLIKTVLMLRHRTLVPSLNLRRANPELDLENSPFEVVTQCRKWENAHPRRAGVSAFGVGGTNAHLVLEEAPSRPQPAKPPRPAPRLLALSARDEKALLELAERYRELLNDAQTAPDFFPDACFTSAAGRKHFCERLAIVAADAPSAARQLEAAASGGRTSWRTVRGRCNEEEGAPPGAFLFTGQGSHYAGMGLQLYAAEKEFRKGLDMCGEILAPRLPCSLPELLASSDGPSLLEQTAFAQPALFALQFALTRLWRAWGIRPKAVMGHSIGEYAAACLAGVFSLEDALLLVAERGRLMEELSPRGCMAAVLADRQTVEAAMSVCSQDISIAALNGPGNVVVSGLPQAVEDLTAELSEKGIRSRTLPVARPFHSSLMQPVQEAFGEFASGFAFRSPKLVWVSGLTGRCWEEEAPPGADYWAAQLSGPVRFGEGMQSLQQLGCRAFVEAGPGAALLGMGRRCLPVGSNLWLASLRQRRGELEQMLQSLGALYTCGAAVDWQGVYPPQARRRVPLPTYPFQRRRCWVETRGAESVGRRPGESTGWASLGARLPSPLREIQFEASFSPQKPSFLKDHRVHGEAVFPAVGFLDMALCAASQCLAPGCLRAENLATRQALVLPEGEERMVQLILTPQERAKASFQVFSPSLEAGQDWRLLADGQVMSLPLQPRPPAEPLEELRRRCPRRLSPEAFYSRLQQEGLEHGAGFQGVRRLWAGSGEALGRIEATAATLESAGNYQIHPVLLSSCLKVIEAAATGGGQSQGAFLPLLWERITLYAPLGNTLWSHARIRPSDASVRSADVRLLDESGALLAELEGLHFKRESRDAMLRQEASRRTDGLLYEVQWRRLPKEQRRGRVSGEPGFWLILADRGGVGRQLEGLLAEDGRQCLAVFEGAGSDGGERLCIDPLQRRSFARLLNEAEGFRRLPWQGIVHLWSLDAPRAKQLTCAGLMDHQQRVCGGLLHFLQEWTSRTLSTEASPRLWLVTRGAQPAGRPQERLQPAQAPFWGLGRVAAQEHAELRCSLIDLDPAAAEAECARGLQEEMLADSAEDQLALRGEGRFAPRLKRHRRPLLNGPAAVSIRPEGAYLITGGLGGLGLATARWLADQGARFLVLLGRKPPSQSAARQLDSLRQAGVQVLARQADVCSPTELQAVFEEVQESGAPLRGVVHCAGALDDALIIQQDWPRFSKILSAKLEGAWNLHLLTAKLRLDFLALFSSMASLLAPLRRGSYAAANAFLDTLAHFRRSQGLAATSWNWGTWQSVGMAQEIEQSLEELSRSYGLELLQSDRAMQAFGRLFPGSPVQAGIIQVRWPSYFQRFSQGAVPPFYEALQREAQRAGQAQTLASAADRPVDGRSASSPAPRQLPGDLRSIVGELRRHLAALLGAEESQMDAEQSITRMGIDSLMSIELRNSIEERWGISLPMVQFLAGPSVDEIARRLLQQAGRPRQAVSGDCRSVPPGSPEEAASGWEEGEL